MKTYYYIFTLIFIFYACSKADADISQPINQQEMYFPPIDNNYWETISINDLNWNEQEVQPLLNYLEETHAKSFIVLYNGQIVIEKYFNNHAETKPWYWASAGKTLTATTIGIAEQNGIININTKVSNYLGDNWTSAPLSKEHLITSRHLLTMTSGLDDGNGDNVSSSNLIYKADAGSRWAYHNVYVKLQDIITNATNEDFSTYFKTHLKDKIGMTGTWIQTGDLSVYWSNTRSMARFGLLALNKGKWMNTQIVNSSFFNDATNTSQSINKAYGYLWWLNGKESYHLPQTQFEFSGKLIPNAPDDMFAALGKNDQKIYVVPSKKLVIIRMGDSAEDSNFALSSFDNNLWEKINKVLN